MLLKNKSQKTYKNLLLNEESNTSPPGQVSCSTEHNLSSYIPEKIVFAFITSGYSASVTASYLCRFWRAVLFSLLFVCLSAGSRKQLRDVHKILETGRVSTREEMIKSYLQHSLDILSHSQTVQITDVKTERGLG